MADSSRAALSTISALTELVLRRLRGQGVGRSPPKVREAEQGALVSHKPHARSIGFGLHAAPPDKLKSRRGFGMVLAQRIYALTEDELEALRRLNEKTPAPGRDDPVWSYLQSLGLVWLDTAASGSPTYRLTSVGRGYATD